MRLLAFCCLILAELLIGIFKQGKYKKWIWPCVAAQSAACFLFGVDAVFPLLVLLIWEWVELLGAGEMFYQLCSVCTLLLWILYAPPLPYAVLTAGYTGLFIFIRELNRACRRQKEAGKEQTGTLRNPAAVGRISEYLRNPNLPGSGRQCGKSGNSRMDLHTGELKGSAHQHAEAFPGRLFYLKAHRHEPHPAGRIWGQRTAGGRGTVSGRIGSGPGSACFGSFSKRELEVVELIAQGLSNQEIADRLFISNGTVRNHVSLILEKCGLKHRTQIAVRYLNKRAEGE